MRFRTLAATRTSSSGLFRNAAYFLGRHGWRVPGLVVVAAISGLLEIMSMFVLFVYIAAVVSPESARGATFRELFEVAFGPMTPGQFSLAAGAALLFYFTVKHLFSLFDKYVSAKAVDSIYRSWTEFLLDLVTNISFKEQQRIGRTRLASLFRKDLEEVFQNVLLPTVYIVSDIVTLLLVVFIALYVDPMMTSLGGGIIALAAAVFFVSVRKRIAKHSARTRKARSVVHKNLDILFDGMREIILYGNGRLFIGRFLAAFDARSRGHSYLRVLEYAPKIVNEYILITGIVAVISAVLLSGRDVMSVLPALAVIAFAGIRIIAIASRLSTNMSKVGFYRESMAETVSLIEEIKGLSAISDRTDNSGSIARADLELKNVCVDSPDGSTRILSGIDMKIPAGKFCGIVGISGAGKSTLLNVMLGLYEQDEGTIRVGGTPLETVRSAWRRALAVVPQSPVILPATIRDNIAFGGRSEKVDDAFVLRVLDAVSMKEAVMTMSQGLDTMLDPKDVPLSGGQIQRLAIARALYRKPDILVLDEATGALDPVTERNILRAIGDLYPCCTVISVTHRIETLRDADIVYVLENGHLVASGNYDCLMTSSSSFRELSRPKCHPAV